MTKTDTSPPGAEVAESQSELLFQALERFIDHMETSERTLEWIEEQAREGNALRGLTEEATEEYLNDLRARIAVRVERDASSRRGTAHRAQVVREIASAVNRECYVQLSERLLEEALSLSQEFASQQRALKAAQERSAAAVNVAARLENEKEREASLRRKAEG